jgi:chaperonin cofactor prefoldin
MSEDDAVSKCCSEAPALRPTVTQNLAIRKTKLEQELQEVTEALDALTANPEVERILNLVSKIGRW